MFEYAQTLILFLIEVFRITKPNKTRTYTFCLLSHFSFLSPCSGCQLKKTEKHLDLHHKHFDTKLPYILYNENECCNSLPYFVIFFAVSFWLPGLDDLIEKIKSYHQPQLDFPLEKKMILVHITRLDLFSYMYQDHFFF